MGYENLIVEPGCITTVTLNRPSRRNALSEALMAELISCLEEAGRDTAVRCLILAAAGDVFCSGHDLTELKDRSLGDYRRIFALCSDLMMKIQAIPQPVIARVQGFATAAGCQLVASCDLALASEKAAFATPGVKIGLFCSTPMVALTRVIGRKRAFEMLATGDPINARTAADWGLVNRAVPHEQLDAETWALAERIAAASSLVIGLGKQAFYAQIDLDQPKAYAYAQEVMSLNALAQDAGEGIAAFLEKRAPKWCGK